MKIIGLILERDYPDGVSPGTCRANPRDSGRGSRGRRRPGGLIIGLQMEARIVLL